MRGGLSSRRAAFLDRDGVLTANVRYADSGRWEAPRRPEEFALLPGCVEALWRLRGAGYRLFVVSNQPNMAKGKTTREEFEAMRARLLIETVGLLEDAFYCLHHPPVDGPCECRKPGAALLHNAIAAYGLQREHCWMFGDRVTDMECGRAAGVRTAWIDTGQEPVVPIAALWDLSAHSLSEVVTAMLGWPL